MNASQWVDLIKSAAADPGGDTMQSLAGHLAACERAKSWLRAKHYGRFGEPIDLMVREVPSARITD